ncbi:hypothetical protein CLI64_03400 [Nostoc sp. CENA543]|nr:hypothetical protein CLI64_03400 [Nostoc sp. CENA543]
MIQWQNLYKLDVPVAANAKPNYLSDIIPIHKNLDTDINPKSFAASKFFNCELRIANCQLV